MKTHWMILAACLLLAACQSPPKDGVYDDPFDARDPAKPLNETILDFNLFMDGFIVRPVATMYHQVPADGRTGVSHFLTNLSEPGNIVTSLLQLKPEAAFTAFWRFVLNTTLGMGGLRDFAGENGLPYSDQPFSAVLAHYGMREGDYVMLPFAGPSTTRDSLGRLGDFFLDPLGLVMTTPQSVAQIMADGLSTRDENAIVIDQYYYDSLLPYNAMRAAYLQHEAFRWRK